MRKIPSQIPLTIYSLSWIFNFFVEAYQECIRIPIKYLNTYPANIFVFQDVLKISWRCLECNNFWSYKTFWRRFEDVFKTCLQNVFQKCLQDVLARRLLQDVLKMSCNYILKTSWRRLEDVLEDKKMLHWRRLQYVFTKTTVCMVRQCFVQKIVFGKLHFRYLTGFRILLCLCYLVFTKTPLIPLNNILSNWRPFSHLMTRKSLKRKYFSIFFKLILTPSQL